MSFNYRQILAQVTEYNSDPMTLLSQAEEIRRQCLEQGVVNEKVNVRMEDGLVAVLERMPQTALDAIKLKFAIFKWLQERADLEQEENVGCQLIIMGAVDMSTPGEMKRYGN